MVDVNRYTGATSPKDEPVPKKDTPLDEQKFKKVLKTEEVSESDPRTGKKRKRKEEEEEEEGIAKTPPPPEGTFSLHEAEKSLGNLFEVKTAPLPSPFSAKEPSSIEEAPLLSATPPEEDPRFEESFDKAVAASSGVKSTAMPSTPSEEEATPGNAPPKESSGGRTTTPQSSSQQVQPASAPAKESTSSKAKDKKAEKIIPQQKTGVPIAQKSVKEETLVEKGEPLVQGKPIEKKEKLSEQKMVRSKAPTTSLKEKASQEALPVAKEEELAKQVEKTPQTKETSIIKKKSESEGMPVKKEEKVKPVQQPATAQIGISQLSTPPPLIPTQEPIPIPKQVELHEFYYQMVGTITASIPNKSGDLHIVINLDSPNFQKNPFFGTQIIIERFSTAPGVYHIQLAAKTEQNLSLFRSEQNNLQEVLKQSMPFEVRLRAPILSSQTTSYRTVNRKGGGGAGEKGQEK